MYEYMKWVEFGPNGCSFRDKRGQLTEVNDQRSVNRPNLALHPAVARALADYLEQIFCFKGEITVEVMDDKTRLVFARANFTASTHPPPFRLSSDELRRQGGLLKMGMSNLTPSEIVNAQTREVIRWLLTALTRAKFEIRAHTNELSWHPPEPMPMSVRPARAKKMA